jgi:hypothetical protein
MKTERMALARSDANEVLALEFGDLSDGFSWSERVRLERCARCFGQVIFRMRL